VTHDEAVPFPIFDLEIWGHAHRDYFSMAPLRGPRQRSTRWQVAMAHGHYEPPETRANPLRPSWVFSDEEIAATGVDYPALGHWDGRDMLWLRRYVLRQILSNLRQDGQRQSG
jgi:hypothetical protein